MTNRTVSRIEFRFDGETIHIIHDDPGERLLSAIGTAADSKAGNARLRWLLRVLSLRMDDWDLLESARRKLESGGLINALSVTFAEECRDDRMKSFEPRCAHLVSQLIALSLEMRATKTKAWEALIIPAEETEKEPPVDQSGTA